MTIPYHPLAELFPLMEGVSRIFRATSSASRRRPSGKEAFERMKTLEELEALADADTSDPDNDAIIAAWWPIARRSPRAT